MDDISADQLKHAVEAQHGGTATLVQSVPVRETIHRRTENDGMTVMREETIWEGVVHVFDLAEHPKATRAYAWPSALVDGEHRLFAVLHMGQVAGPHDAVKAALSRRRQGDIAP